MLIKLYRGRNKDNKLNYDVNFIKLYKFSKVNPLGIMLLVS